MGLIRKTLYLGTGGAVAPHSKKQRVSLQQLAALQGASPEQVRRTGGRYDFDSAVTGTPRVQTGQSAQDRTGTAMWGYGGGRLLRFHQAKMQALGAGLWDAARYQSPH